VSVAAIAITSERVAVAARDWKWKGLSVEALTDVVVVARVERATLHVTKEVVQSLDSASPGVHALLLGHVGTRIVDLSITRVLVWVGVDETVVLSKSLTRRRVWVAWVMRLEVGILVVLLYETVVTALLLVHVVLWRAQQNRVVGMSLDMLLEILWTLEGLAAKVALVWLERNMYAHVRGDVVALHGGGSACAPLAGEVQVVCRLATDVALADVVLYEPSAMIRKYIHEINVRRASRAKCIARRRQPIGK